MAEYTTLVLRHENEEEAKTVTQLLQKRYPMIRNARSRGKTRMTGIAMGDVMSLNDMAVSILQSRILSRDECADLASEILNCSTHEECATVLTEWEVQIKDGELIEAEEIRFA